MRRLKQIGTRSLAILEQALKSAPDLEQLAVSELAQDVETTLTPETCATCVACKSWR